MKDSEAKLGPAVNLYCEALEHFLPAIECKQQVRFVFCTYGGLPYSKVCGLLLSRLVTLPCLSTLDSAYPAELPWYITYVT